MPLCDKMDYDTFRLQLNGIVSVRKNGVGRRTGTMGKKKEQRLLALGMSGCLLAGLLSGCGSKTVDYNMETEQPAETVSGGLTQFADAERWKEKWQVPDGEGSSFTMSVNAEVTVPDVEQMYVAEVEETVMDAQWKADFMNLYYGGESFYYHDLPHYTKEELETHIRWCQENQEAVDDPSYRENYEGEREVLTEIHQEQMDEYEKYLAGASEDYTVATDLDSCREYLGTVGGLDCYVLFSALDEKNAGKVVNMTAAPMDTEQFGPETDFEYVSMYRDRYPTQTGENTCSLSMEEAREIADDFITRMGRNGQVCQEEADTVWTRVARSRTGVLADTEEVTYGYSFTYGTGVEGVAFNQFGNVSEYDCYWEGMDWNEIYDFTESTVITVTDEGVVGVEMNFPMTLQSLSQPVELLSLETVQGIMRDEVTEHGAEYPDFQAKPYFFAMELVYFRVRDDGREGCYSYVPAWRLSAKADGFFYHPVLVNAIDGSVIHIREEL